MGEGGQEAIKGRPPRLCGLILIFLLTNLWISTTICAFMATQDVVADASRRPSGGSTGTPARTNFFPIQSSLYGGCCGHRSDTGPSSV